MNHVDAVRWDQVAGHFQSIFRMGINEYNASLLRFWAEEGMLFPGARVIDIGCGVGKYGTWFAELGCDVTLTDISSEMLRYASENMAKYETPWTTYQCDFREITGDESVFLKKYDLAVSTMSPAVNDVETVRKMSVMTSGWCFLSRFFSWSQPFRDLLVTELGLKPRQMHRDLEEDCSQLISNVKDAGYRPNVRYVNYDWEDHRTSEQMADYLLANYFDELEQDRYSKKLLRLAEKHADVNGLVTDAVNTQVAWISWKTDHPKY